MNHLIDFKVSLLSGLFLFISFSDVEVVMKIIVFLLTMDITLKNT